MNARDPDSLPPLPDPAAVDLERVQSPVRQGHVGQAVEIAAAAAVRRAKAALDRYRSHGGPVREAEARRRFLEAMQAAGEEMDRIARAVTGGKKAEG